MTSQDALRALTPEQAARLGELDEIADTAAAVADLAQIDHDVAQADYDEAADKRAATLQAVMAANERADDARAAAVAFRAQAGVVRTASGYLTRAEAARRFGPPPSAGETE